MLQKFDEVRQNLELELEPGFEFEFGFGFEVRSPTLIKVQLAPEVTRATV